MSITMARGRWVAVTGSHLGAKVQSKVEIDYPPFIDGALCPETDTEIFFPEKGGSTKDAKSVCGRCPVREQCLEWALEREERFGIWGGHSERERRKIKKARKALEEAA